MEDHRLVVAMASLYPALPYWLHKKRVVPSVVKEQKTPPTNRLTAGSSSNATEWTPCLRSSFVLEHRKYGKSIKGYYICEGSMLCDTPDPSEMYELKTSTFTWHSQTGISAAVKALIIIIPGILHQYPFPSNLNPSKTMTWFPLPHTSLSVRSFVAAAITHRAAH